MPTDAILRISPRFRSLAAAGLLGLSAGLAAAQSGGSGGIDPTAPPPDAPSPLDPSERDPARAQTGLIDLRPKFRMGESYVLRVTQKSDGRLLLQEMAGIDRTEPEETAQNVTQVFELRFTPREVGDDGSATVDMVVDAVKMEFRSGDLEATFDSTAPTATTPQRTTRPATRPAPAKSPTPSPNQPGTVAPAAPALPGGLGDMTDADLLRAVIGPLVGSVTTLRFGADGNVTRISGGEAWNMSGLAGLGGGMAGGMAGGSPSAFGELLALKKGTNLVRVGETWTTRSGTSSSPVGGLVMDTRYTLTSATPSQASINFNGAIEPGSSGMLGMQVTSGRYDGRAQWDRARGFLRSMRASTTVSIEGVAAGQKARLTSTNTIEADLIR